MHGGVADTIDKLNQKRVEINQASICKCDVIRFITNSNSFSDGLLGSYTALLKTRCHF